MTTGQQPNARIEKDAKVAAWKEHVADIDTRVKQLRAFETQVKAWSDTLAVNVKQTVDGWVTQLESVRKNLAARIDAGS